MEIVETVRVTKAFGRKPGNLEMLWFLRDQAERRLSEHLRGEGMSADVFAAANTPDEAWEIEDVKMRPSQMWKIYKEAYFEEIALLAELANVARRNVRIATGHEPIGKMVCRP